MTIGRIKELASKHGWKLLCHQENSYMLSFQKPEMRINVYYTKMTVTTCINHPRQGKTQLFRRNVDNKLMDKIFENPRIHTGLGYFTK